MKTIKETFVCLKSYLSYVLLVVALNGVYANVNDVDLINLLTNPVLSNDNDLILEVSKDYRGSFFTVVQSADVVVNSLPFTHSSNTSIYGNDYSGRPGENCGVTENYLNGNDVIYSYTAVQNDIINIKLKGLNEFYAGMFLYNDFDDIGKECVASAIAGPSKNDIEINGFSVKKGETYYIVISSWLSSSINYTIEMRQFACTDLISPEADTVQYFVNGETMETLNAATTHLEARLNWYLDVGLTNKVSDLSSVSLSDGDKYYVTQSLLNCESAAIEVSVSEVTCSDLSITSTVGANVDCSGEMHLEVTPTGVGNQVYWYASEEAERILNRGNTMITPDLAKTTSYWVSEVYLKEAEPIYGQGKAAYDNPSSLSIPAQGRGLYFDAYKSFMIQDVEIFVTGGGNGSILIELLDEDDIVLEQKRVEVPTGTMDSPASVVLSLNFYVPEAGTYRLMARDPLPATNLLRETSTYSNFPHRLGDFGRITDGAGGTSNRVKNFDYSYFYNWTISDNPEIACESPRKEVIAEVNQFSDVIIEKSDLPFLDRSNTSSFNNIYSGQAGDNCVGGRYLDGYEAIYKYVASSSAGDILQIQLSDVDNLDAAVFVYNSCGSIGVDCIDGAIIEDGKAVIEDVFVAAGDEILIVVSSSSGNVEYSLSVDGIYCDGLIPPTGDTSPNFISGETIADLVINQFDYIEAFKWYRDEDLKDEISDLNSELLQDGTSYFVTQIIQGCESLALEIIPSKFDCDEMSINVPTKVNYVCMPSGYVTLSAEPSEKGNDIYWYDAPSDGNIVGRGESITVFADRNTSYWVSEVQKRSQGTPGNELPTYCIPIFNGTCENMIDFTVKNMNDDFIIAHLNTECSEESYGNFTQAKYLNATMYAGEEYYFEATHESSSGQYISIWLDLNGNGRFENVSEGVFTSEEPGNYREPSSGSFKIPEDILSRNTVMRVVNSRIKNLPNDVVSCSSAQHYFEIQDYKITLIGESVVCESPREEVVVEINNSHTKEPTVSSYQVLCGNPILSDIKVLGPSIKWYDSRGRWVSEDTPIIVGERYFVTQTIKGCESALKEIIIDVKEESSLPEANVNQVFNTGETLEDLVVEGENIIWYADQWKSRELPTTTPLQDQETYYVAQVQEDKCEGQVLGITVHEFLGVADKLFKTFNFYPNPVTDILHFSNSSEIEQIEIYDLKGKMIFKQNYNDLYIELDVSIFSSGTYLLKVQVEGQNRSYRMIKK